MSYGHQTPSLRRSRHSTLLNPRPDFQPGQFYAIITKVAPVAELADALASGASGRKAVQVQPLSGAPITSENSFFYSLKIHLTLAPVLRATFEAPALFVP